jgi:hypothetical protein
MKHVCRLWRGELALENAFWNWAVFGGLIINVSSSTLFLFLVMADRPIPALIVGYAFSVPYNFVVLLGVWRSADRYTGDRRWADLVRLVTIIGAVLFSVT